MNESNFTYTAKQREVHLAYVGKNTQQEKERTWNVTPRRVHVISVAVESNKYYIFVCVCVCVCVHARGIW